MLWYLVVCILMLYPFTVVHLGHRSGKNTQKIALFSGCLILWFFMAMRDTSVGADTQYYSYVFTQYAGIPLSKVFTAVTYATNKHTWAFDFEPGYRLMNKLVSCICAHPQAITIVNSTIIMLLLYNLIRRYSPDYPLSLWLYLTLGIFQTEMNVTRNALAILLLYNGFGYIHRGSFPKYLLCCLAASLIHLASLTFIPVYWIARHYHPSFKKNAVIISVFLLLGLVFPALSASLSSPLPVPLEKYFSRGNDNPASLLVGVLHAAIFFLVYFTLPKGQRQRVFQECRLGVILLMIDLCFLGLHIHLDYASRMAALFGPYLMILIPQMLELHHTRAKKASIAVLTVLACGVQYILRMCINNIGGTMPYSFFW